MEGPGRESVPAVRARFELGEWRAMAMSETFGCKPPTFRVRPANARKDDLGWIEPRRLGGERRGDDRKDLRDYRSVAAASISIAPNGRTECPDCPRNRSG